MTRDEWLAEFAARIGVTPPDASRIDTLLDLAGAAAHASERTAAPIACWMSAVAGLAPEEALRIARSITAD